MKKICNIDMGELNGSLYLYKLGYGFKIKRKYDGLEVGRSYCYFVKEDMAMERMKEEMEIITNQLKLL